MAYMRIKLRTITPYLKTSWGKECTSNEDYITLNDNIFFLGGISEVAGEVSILGSTIFFLTQDFSKRKKWI